MKRKKQRSKRKEYEITNERKRKRERERMGEKWSSSEINGPSCRHLLNLFIVATNIITHRYVVVVSQHGVHSMISGGKGQEDKKKGHRSPSMLALASTRRTPDDDAGRSS